MKEASAKLMEKIEDDIKWNNLFNVAKQTVKIDKKGRFGK